MLRDFVYVFKFVIMHVLLADGELQLQLGTSLPRALERVGDPLLVGYVLNSYWAGRLLQ